MAKEGTKKSHSLQDFGGINTQASRRSIKDNEFSWIENVMPIGFGNMPAINAPSAALTTLTGETCYYMKAANINNVDYMYMFCSSGAAYQVNLTSFAKTKFANNGTFSSSGVRVAQWKNERILITDPNNGYFDWDGATLTAYKGTVFSVTITAAGNGFTSVPTITPSSGAATFSATLSAGISTLSAAGTGYAVGDILTQVGGTFTTATQYQVTTVSGGAITAFSIYDSGVYTVPPSTPASVTGGHGSSATFTPNYGIGAVTVLTPGTGYSSAPGLTVSGGGGSNAILTANLSNSISGNDIATYSGRVWIVLGRTIVFSAPNSYQDFTTASFGGSFIITDETLHSNIISILSANNFLYIFGSNSINVISDVAINSNVTTFSNTNITASVGTIWPSSIVPYFRSVWFANQQGVYALYGSTPNKASDNLDGIFTKIIQSQFVSSGIVQINNILCLAFLCKYQDTSSQRNILLIYFNKKWFVASQGTINYIESAALSGVESLFSTDGTNLYQLFSNTTSSISQTIQTKLWDMGGNPITKQALKFGIESLSPTQTSSISVGIDTEFSTQTYFTNTTNQITWYNNAGGIISWTNNASQTIVWIAAGYTFSMQDVNNVGNYLGVTITSSTPGVIYSGFHLQYEERTPWIFKPW